MIDLHTHSTFSDGSLTPEALADRARRLGLRAVALTDHDTCSGVPRFLAACRSVPEHAGLVGIPGVEISVEVPRGTLHLLGYYVDSAHAGLNSALRRIRDGREERNRTILERLRCLGYSLSWEEVRSRAGEEVVGRTHFAQALLARGWVQSLEEAFERLLAKGRPAYVSRYRLAPAEAMRFIHEAGGVPVLAHPFTLELSPSMLRSAVREWKAMGLEGVEAYYSEHTAEQTAQYLALATELDLVVTGGSDFHGSVNPAIEMGRGFGSLRVPDRLLETLEKRRPLPAGSVWMADGSGAGERG